MLQRQIDDDTWRRLHYTNIFHSKWLLLPLTLPFVAILTVLLSTPSFDSSLLLVLSLVFVVLSATFFLPVFVVLLFRHYRYRFQFHDDRLVVRTGLFELNDKVVPYEMLHGIDLTRSPLHRLFGTVRINLQTRSMMFAAMDFRSVRPSVAEELGDRLNKFQQHRTHTLVSVTGIDEPHPTNADREIQLHRMSILECCKLGFVRSRIPMILSVIVTFVVARFSQLGSLVGDSFGLAIGPIDMKFLGGWMPWVEISIQKNVEIWELSVFLAILVCVFLVLLSVMSLMLAIVQFYKFQLTLNDEILRRESGLFIRAVQNTPLHRLQAIRIVSTVRSRLLERESIWFGTSAMPALEAQQDRSFLLSNWLVPLVPSSNTREIARRVLPPNVDFENEAWETINVSRVWKRRLNFHLIYVFVLTVIFALVSLWLLALTVLLVGWAILVSRLYAKSLRYQLLDNAIMFHKGWWKRQWTIVPFDKVQVVKVTQNPFDRRFRMATLSVDVAAFQPPYLPICLLRMPYIQVDRCREIQDILIRESSRRENAW